MLYEQQDPAVWEQAFSCELAGYPIQVLRRFVFRYRLLSGEVTRALKNAASAECLIPKCINQRSAY